MSIIHVNQIASKIRELFEGKIDLTDIGKNDSQRTEKVLSRCLAAYAVYNYTGCPCAEAASSVVDGGDDNGIDAIYYSPSSRQMVMVQSKWIKKGTGEPESGEIGKFCKGIRDLFNMNFDRFNQKLQNRGILSSPSKLPSFIKCSSNSPITKEVNTPFNKGFGQKL